MSARFAFLVVSVHSPALEVTGDLDGEERRTGRSGNDLGTGLTECNGGIDKFDTRPREEVFFASLSRHVSGKTDDTRETEVTREVD
jgi:hypothetical protein